MPRGKYADVCCIKCKETFKTVSFKKHSDKCDGSGRLYLTRKIATNKYIKLDSGKYECPHCGKECTALGISSHIRIVHDNGGSFVGPGCGNTPWNKGKTCAAHPELKEKLSAGGKALSAKIASGEFDASTVRKNFWTEEKRKARSEEKKLFYKMFPEKHPNRKLAGNRNRMTYPEQVAFKWLTENNIIFVHQARIENIFVDFLVGNIVIEIDGERWHPIGNQSDKDRDIRLKSLGYLVFRIRSKEKIEERLSKIFEGTCTLTS